MRLVLSKPSDEYSVTRFVDIFPLLQKLKVLGSIWKDYLVFLKFLTCFGKLQMLLGKFWLLQTAKYWKTILPSGHTERGSKETFLNNFLLKEKILEVSGAYFSQKRNKSLKEP